MIGLLLLGMTLSPSVPPAQPDAAHLQRALERLPEGARVLYLAAHPDDENTRLISFLVQVKKLRVAYLSITRGDGGQNLIGKEQGPALGLLRTQELLAARRMDGADQFFTSARDFGYSKNPEETLRFWGHDRILEDVVFVYRSFKPDVIITRFSPLPSETHGQHTASAQLAVEAFTKAADPTFAPEQVKAHGTWKARRVVWNAFLNDPKEDTSRFLKLDTNPYDPLLGVSMGEIAGESRSMHKSQGFGAPRGVLPVVEYFQVIAGEPMKDSFLDGLQANVPQGAISRALAAFRPDAPQLALPALLEAYAASPRPEIAEAIVACAGLALQAVTDVPAVVPGSALPVTLAAVPRVAAGLALASVRLGAAEIAGPGALTAPWVQKSELKQIPPAIASDPAWLRKPPEEGYYPVEAEEDRVRPEPAPVLFADFSLLAGKQIVTVRRPLVYKWIDPVQGERTRAVEIAPPATIDASAPVLFLPDAAPRQLRVSVRASAGPVEGTALVEAPAEFSVEPRQRPFRLESGETELVFDVRAMPHAREGQLRLSVKVGGAAFDRGLRRLDYAHIPPQAWHPESRVRLVHLDLRRGSARTIGYIAGAGDEVSAVLAQLGYQVTSLDETAVRERDLSAFDAIVVGVRAYNVNPWLAALKGKLLAYVEHGGVLVTQYNTKNFISKLPEPLGPYPMTIAQQRVTDETAEVAFVQDDAVLRAPNRIGPEDFAGWVQERGLYFVEKWDDRYTAPLSMHDPGEQPLRGSLLIARVGKGRFVYTGLAFFRQLPAGVPGAVRLFANLLSRDRDAG
ncbi:MAG TPA: PIG-L family deacetylase [Myxococcales bacterium]|nr:PIG-L family deacetylase [Myxococcales bacterium]